jgi:MFS transporter, ACS family, D-galactonate transporter
LPKGIANPTVDQGKRVLLLLLGLSIFINYVDRSNLSIAAPFIKDELNLSASQLGILLSSFFWAYAPLQPVSGWLVDRFDPSWILGLGFLVWSAATGLTGVAYGFATLFALRILLGIGESVAYPSYGKILSSNFSEARRGFANSIIAAGLTCGPAFGMFFGGMLVAKYGWRPYFVVLGAVSMIWLVAWWRWKPAPIAETTTKVELPSFAKFVRLRQAWGTCLALFFLNYLNYFLITWLPFYLVRGRGYSLEQMAKIAGTAYLTAAVVATLSGWLSDRWIRAGASPTFARLAFNAGGVAVGSVALLVCAAFPEYSAWLMICATAGYGITAANVWAVTQTLAGPAVGRWVGIQNLVGNLSGILAPAVTGFVLDKTGNFMWPFVITAFSGLMSSVCWITLVRPVKEVDWSDAGSSALARVSARAR